MTCPHCGAPVLADAEVCPVCGTARPGTGEAARPGWPAPPPGPAGPGVLSTPGYGAPNPYAPPPTASAPAAGQPLPGWHPTPPTAYPPAWAPGPPVAGYPPAGPPVSPAAAYAPPGYPAAGYGPPGYPPASPYGRAPGGPGGFPAAYPYAPPPRRSNAAFLWSGAGLLALSLFLCLCVGLVLVVIGQDATNSAKDIRDTQLGGVICLLGVLFVLSVPGLILLIVGLRRRV